MFSGGVVAARKLTPRRLRLVVCGCRGDMFSGGVVAARKLSARRLWLVVGGWQLTTVRFVHGPPGDEFSGIPPPENIVPLVCLEWACRPPVTFHAASGFFWFL